MLEELFDLPEGKFPDEINSDKLSDLEKRSLQILSIFTVEKSKTEWIRLILQIVNNLPHKKANVTIKRTQVTSAIKTLSDEGILQSYAHGFWYIDKRLHNKIALGTKGIPELLDFVYASVPLSFSRNDYTKIRASVLMENTEYIKSDCYLSYEGINEAISAKLLPTLSELGDFSIANKLFTTVSSEKRDYFFRSGPYFLTEDNWQSWMDLLEQQKENLPECTIELTCSILQCILPETEQHLFLEKWMPYPSANFFLELLRGETTKALEKGELFLQTNQEYEGHKRKELPGFYGLLYALVLLKSEDKKKKDQAISFVRNTIKKNKENEGFKLSPLLKFAQSVEKFCAFQTGKSTTIEGEIYRLYKNETDQYFGAIVCKWAGKELVSFDFPSLLSEKKEMELLLSGYKPRGASEATISVRTEELKEKLGASLSELFQPAEPWEAVLRLLTNEIETPAKKTKAKLAQRLVWYIDPLKEDYIQPIVQTQNKQGWDKGKEKSLRALVKNIPEFATPNDLKITNHIHSDRYGTYIKDWEKLVKDLVGNDQLYTWFHPHLPLEITKQEAQLEMNKGSKGATISISATSPMRYIEQESETRYVYIHWSDTMKKVYAVLSQQKDKKVTIPTNDLKKAGSILTTIGKSIPVSGNLVPSTNKSILSKNIPVIQLTPVDAHLHIQILIEPIAGTNFHIVPGVGANRITYSDKEGNTIEIERNKQRETMVKKELIENISYLADVSDTQSELFLDEDEQILDFLIEIRQNAPEVKVIWPKGERLHVPKVASYSDMSMGIKEKNNWFEIGGHIQVSDTKKLSIQELLDETKGGKLKYVALDEKTFLGIERDLQKKLQELDAVVQNKGGKIGVHPLGTNAVESLLESVPNATTDKGWKQHIDNLDKLKEYKPLLPNNLQATLRPYQEEGFQWLDRLHQWGVGACLADDMGLGKTIQSIALLIKYGTNGPSLVIAPSSVCSNWKKELHRFAPTLAVKELKLQKREEALAGLTNNEVLIVSYGLIQSNPDLLSKRDWNIAILDEAHAIKNSKSIRSKAVMKLKANFKMITTGTPIQNHLGELWNLFEFINPDMLGTYDSFIKRYVQFENDGKSHQNRKALNRYLAPFILRRNKGEVLDDLPEKTEITLEVTLSHEERAMYETIRANAVESITKNKEEGGAKHIQILAEITKLRQVSCNSALIVPENPIESSKMQALENLIDDLRTANHKALIFSQFTKHLDIIRAMVEKKGISYQYLDGSTSTKKRDQAINAFQNGESELFLISLKAGGVGLNLTAADYVIHMDPWWNPAIEDQASDRAHRIGQTRPVTIYRIIAKDTIEEKIVKMHHNKRNIADQLLANTDQAAKISSEELFDLLKK